MLSRTNLIVGYILFSIGFSWGQGNCVHLLLLTSEREKQITRGNVEKINFIVEILDCWHRGFRILQILLPANLMQHSYVTGHSVLFYL